MDLLKGRLSEDRNNIQLRHYCLIELILNSKWNDILDVLEETPYIQLNLIQFVFKYFPLTMINNERIEKLKERFKSLQIGNEKSLFQIDRNDQILSSSSSSTSIESLDQSQLFLSKAKFYKKSFKWIKIGKGECEIIENNQSGEIFLRFWIIQNHSINLVFLLNLNLSENYSLHPNISSSFIIQFQSKNECDYPISNELFQYQIQFNSMMDVIQFKHILSLRK